MANSELGWAARDRHGSVTLSDGSVVVIGGYSDTSLSDVWMWSNPSEGGE